jgi:hypothetical protein
MRSIEQPQLRVIHMRPRLYFDIVSHEAPVGPELHQVVTFNRDDDTGDLRRLTVESEWSDYETASGEREASEEGYHDGLADDAADPPDLPYDPHAEWNERAELWAEFCRREADCD